ncbi:Bem46 protein [Legionella steigerwaltii]|uniref:2-hydroxy-6-oxononadienedioate/2-hydroxy-6-oxononatrienedioate hydrolase n=1 Tax=Legionella steigerwaltii TaxID=460 RepID=A0A378LAP6_9GAMM|nr:alpha/beta hydrolase [Legionella steigerwaltii]KTD71640.1 2-hydroxy-6-oxononadienedioate/2-hydroxy-6-oxononatrienedioate hydrolase [Legionella steigerwaltii]STY23784.1 Bem46 protein [Legionella steigerwaltii]
MRLKQLLLLLFILILIFIASYLLQRSFIYFPSPELPTPNVFHAEDMQVIKIPVADGLTLSSWYKPSKDKKPTILYLHGNAGHIGYRMYLVRQFLSEGFGVLLLEYRGYGGNPGKPTESGLYQDARAAMKFLQQQGIQENNIVLYGESLGTGVATQMATEFPVCALVLQSPYTSLTALARFHYPWLPLPLIDKYDSLSRIQKIHIPVLMLHGKLDEIVPYDQGVALFNHANQPKKWIEFPDKGHQDLWNPHFAHTVMDFISSYCVH